MINTQKPRYEIGYVDPRTLRDELKRVVTSGEFPSSDYQNKKTYVITRDSLKGLVLRYISEIKTKAQNKRVLTPEQALDTERTLPHSKLWGISINKGKCLWKNVAAKDLTKLANGDSCITLSLDKPCYRCDGTKKYAKKINCKAYIKDAEE